MNYLEPQEGIPKDSCEIPGAAAATSPGRIRGDSLGGLRIRISSIGIFYDISSS